MNVHVRYEDFGAAPLIAEYDAERRTIRVNARLVERMRARGGDSAARALIVCAVAHEMHHARHPEATEEEVHTHVRTVTGYDPRVLEAMLR